MENLVKPTEVKSIRVQLEKLDGGYISNVSGKRSIYRSTDDILDVLDIPSMFNTLEENEYHLNIDLVPKDKMEDYVDLIALNNNISIVEEHLSYQQAKELGIIQGADEFNPHTHTEESIEKVIKVTADNAYHIGRLKSIDWNCYDEQLPMTNAERTKIGGISSQAMYNQWRKAKEGKASFHQTNTRVAFTILAKYYEANLGVRSCTKDKLALLKADMLKALRELETTALAAKFVKCSVVSKSINEMRKHLL